MRELRRGIRADQSRPPFEPCLPRPAKQQQPSVGWIHENKQMASASWRTDRAALSA